MSRVDPWPGSGGIVDESMISDRTQRPLLLRRDGPVATITFNRPNRLNVWIASWACRARSTGCCSVAP